MPALILNASLVPLLSSHYVYSEISSALHLEKL